MKIAIMQPYFLPYIGYMQLMEASNRFILFDDVNYINRGWINRNRILLNNQDHLFTLPLVDASQNRSINSINLCDEIRWREKLKKKIFQSYCAAPWFDQIHPLINDIIDAPTSSLSGYLEYSLRAIHEFLGMQCEIITSSSRYKNSELKGQDRILDICRHEQASDYINLPGGTALYQPSAFSEQNINLKFVHPQPRTYIQFGQTFIPNLSVLDVLMFNGRDTTKLMLNEVILQ